MNRNMRTPISIVSNQNVLTQTGLTATEDGRKLESFSSFSRFKRHDLLKLTCTLFAAYTEIRFSCDGAHNDKINSVVQLEKFLRRILVC